MSITIIEPYLVHCDLLTTDVAPLKSDLVLWKILVTEYRNQSYPEGFSEGIPAWKLEASYACKIVPRREDLRTRTSDEIKSGAHQHGPNKEISIRLACHAFVLKHPSDPLLSLRTLNDEQSHLSCS